MRTDGVLASVPSAVRISTRTAIDGMMAPEHGADQRTVGLRVIRCPITFVERALCLAARWTHGCFCAFVGGRPRVDGIPTPCVDGASALKSSSDSLWRC